MTDEVSSSLPQSTTNSQSNAQHLRQKRARSQLSCIPCRLGKLKCDRVHEPACDQCIKRNRETSCKWAPPPTKQKNTQNVKSRVRQLESMVIDLMNQQNGNHSLAGNERKDSTGNRSTGEPTPPSSDENDSLPSKEDVDCAVKPFGKMKISKNEISYVGETHWRAILSGIDSLRRELEDEEDVRHVEEDDDSANTPPWRHDANDANSGWQDPVVPTNGLGFVLRNSGRMTREQLIASVPEKRIADRLLSLWFNSPDPFKPILHGPSFQEQYRSFLRDPSQTPTMWLGLLFAILSLAASFGLRDCDPNSPSGRNVAAEVGRYHALAASAAVLADFTKPKQHTIECLLLYGAGLRSSSNAFVNVWLMIGLCVRLALRMGYHRDSANYPAISPFHGEMRRRVWAAITMLDVLISFQLALPSMVKTVVSDTQPPRNLLDRDFNVDTKVLPPSRGVDELTPSSYTRSKLRIVTIFAEAAELSHATIPPSHDEMMELDRRLEEAKMQLPPLLQMPDISELVTDPAEQLMCRFNIDLLYLKTKIVLHRRYMETPFLHLMPQEQKLGIGMSRRLAVDSALSVLQHHHTIFTASQPGGQLEQVSWYMGSISTHDFLLAAMVICLELSQQITSSSVLNPNGPQCPRRLAQIEALERSQQIWESTGRKRRAARLQGRDPNLAREYMLDDTEKAAVAMRVMLNKVKQRFPTQESVESEKVQGSSVFTTPSLGATSTAPSGGTSFNNQLWDSNMSGNLEMTNMQYYTPNDENLSNPNTNNPYDMPPQLDYLGDMLDNSGVIDWNMFDTGVNKSPTTQEEGHQFLDYSPDDILRIPVAGNALMGDGTGPGTGGNLPEGWLSFRDMDDVGFDVVSEFCF